MTLIEIKNLGELNEFFAENNKSSFLQSWQWGEIQKLSGNKIYRLGIKEDDSLVAVATIISKKITAGKNYFYSPRGPIFKPQAEMRKLIEIEEFLFAEIYKIAQKEKAIFLRFEPAFKIFASPTSNIQKTRDIQPAKTLILDLKKSENELLAEMHPKTRYNIRLAEKKELEISIANQEEFNDYWQIMNATSQRDGFRLHSRLYYYQMLQIENNFIKLIVAKHNNKIIAGNIVSFFGDTVTYVHGASSNHERNLMAPYLIQWHCIKFAKKQGFKYYDFFGIDEAKWPGVTRFKNGFGGSVTDYPGTFDLVFNKRLYYIYKFLRSIRRVI